MYRNTWLAFVLEMSTANKFAKAPSTSHTPKHRNTDITDVVYYFSHREFSGKRLKVQ